MKSFYKYHFTTKKAKWYIFFEKKMLKVLQNFFLSRFTGEYPLAERAGERAPPCRPSYPLSVSQRLTPLPRERRAIVNRPYNNPSVFSLRSKPAPFTQRGRTAAVSIVQNRLYPRCRQRVLRLDLDATFAGFRRTFGAPRGSRVRMSEGFPNTNEVSVGGSE